MVLTMSLLILPKRPSTSHLNLRVQECKIMLKTTALEESSGYSKTFWGPSASTCYDFTKSPEHVLVGAFSKIHFF